MVLKKNWLLIVVLLLSLALSGCSAQKGDPDTGNRQQEPAAAEPQPAQAEKLKTDVPETYTNDQYHFSFDLPAAWAGKYQVVQQDKIVYFVHSGFPELEGKILWIVVLTEDEFKANNAVPPSVPEEVVLGRKNNLVYYYLAPQAVPDSDNSEESKRLLEEWGKMHDALYETPDGVPKRFHLE